MSRRKLPAEMIITAVEEYLGGKASLIDFMRRCAISKKTFQDWVRLYKMRGVEAFNTDRKNRKYPVEVKKHAAVDYLSGKGSLSDICVKYDISSEKMLRQWIMRYNGHEDFRQPNGDVVYMVKGRKTTRDERVDIVSHCIANNKDYGKTVEQYDVSYQQIYSWVGKYEKDGADGLNDRRGKRRNELPMSEVEELRSQLKLKETENLRLQMENDLLKKLELLERGQGEG